MAKVISFNFLDPQNSIVCGVKLLLAKGAIVTLQILTLLDIVNTRKYPLRGYLLGPPGWPEGIFFAGVGTNAVGASGAINGMKR